MEESIYTTKQSTLSTPARTGLMVITSIVFGIIIGVLSLGFVLNSSFPLVGTVRTRLGLTGAGLGSVNSLQQNVKIEESSAVIDATQKVYPAVVSITASRQVANYFGQVSSQEVSGGSGFIVSSDGLVMTNKHVVSERGATYKVVLSDGRVFDGKVQALDSFNDLAVIKIEATGLPVVEMGSSDALKIGQTVFAVGNALGEFKNSVTSGIVSAKQRSLSTQGSSGTSEQLTDLIQTDAAINPGNSGGPLVNLEGQVIGINTAIASTSGGSVGVGFAIPIDSVKPVVASVIKTGQIVRPYLGVRYQAVTKTLQQLNNLSVDYGVLISAGQTVADRAVVAGSPAEKAGLQAGDIILMINDEKIDENTSLQRLLQKYQQGDKVNLKVLRSSKEIVVEVTLGQQS